MKYRMAVKRRKKSRRLYLLFVFSFILFLFIVLNILHKGEPPPEEKEPTSSEKTATPLLEESRYTIRKGMSMSDILTQHDFSPPEIYQLREETKPVYDLAKIKAGQEFRVFQTPDGKVISLEYDIDEMSFLQLRREEGKFKGEIKKIPYEIRVKMVFGLIDDNLITAVNEQGEGDYLALALAELFAWDIDFYTDLRQGDTFKIVFEKKYLENKFIGYRNIQAAEFINQGKPFQAFRYSYPDTKESDYFDLEGNSLRKEFLKSPIKFARITSRFSFNRLHPIRKVYRPHYGVDYAARVGTPVQATADGTVILVGRRGASGRMVTIRHRNDYETLYLHLRNYGRGIRKGAKVKSGQIIGYVGSSGESTGPHLDYRIKYRGKYINPLAWRFKPVRPLRKEFLEDFRKEAEKYILCLKVPVILFSSLLP
ncbi:MAG: peptidoglycan DD-metalloendopeptidase family protein [Candidatus Aminicenantes bacterium]|nr:peptidoglycan DD-metalloendopeptidase family protein [Candidatus Aminicenantes bacterium]